MNLDNVKNEILKYTFLELTAEFLHEKNSIEFRTSYLTGNCMRTIIWELEGDIEL